MHKIKNLLKKAIGYNALKTKHLNLFTQSILYPFALQSHISIEESIFLAQYVQQANAYIGPIVEVGTLFGYSTLVIVQAKKKNKKFMTVDNFRWNPSGLCKNVHADITRKILSEAIDKYSVELIDMDKQKFYRDYSIDPPSMVFFDADHSFKGTLEDLLWAKKIKARIILGHDYTKEHPGVIEAVHEVFPDGPSHLCGSIFLV